MFCLTVVTIIFNALFPTNCYHQQAWNHLGELNNFTPHDAGVLPPNTYVIHPGSKGMFSDIIQEIETRMKGIAKGSFIVMFDFGGIAPKYLSIIEDMASGSGISVDGMSTVMIEPPSTLKQAHFGHNIPMSANGGGGVTSTQYRDEGKIFDSSKSSTPTVATVHIEDTSTLAVGTSTVETTAETPVTILKNDLPSNDEFTTSQKRTRKKIYSGMRSIDSTLPTASIVTPTLNNTVKPPDSIPNEDDSSAGGVASLVKLTMTIPSSTHIPSTSMSAEPIKATDAAKKIASTFKAVEIIEDKQTMKNDPRAAAVKDSSLKILNWGTDKEQSAIGLSKSFLTNTAGGMKNGLEGIRTVELAGKTTTATLYPDHQVSIADRTSNEMMHFTPLSNGTLNAANALALYNSLKTVTTDVFLIIESRGFNCVPLKLTKINLNLYVVDNVAFGEGNICGLKNMQPGNNVTITKDDENIMEVKMPLNLRDLTVKIKSVDVNNYFISIIKGQPIEASVREISCIGTFSFKKGTSFELTSIRIEWGDINGIHFKLEGAMEEGGPVSAIIDNLAGALSGVIKSFVSPILDEIEKQITKNILGN